VRRKLSISASALFIALSSSFAALGQGSVQTMKLLTPQVGWAASSRQVFWTTDAGLNWNDITPPMASPTQEFASVFFLDSSSGWILRVEQDQATGEPHFDLASTASAGASWSITRLDVPDIDPSRGLSSEGWVNFVDASHGWVMVRMNGNTAVSIGVLLITEGDGTSWKSAKRGPPIAGPIRFVTAKQGWLAGGPDDELYRSDDGGESWQPVTLPAPQQMHSTAQASYGLPTFQDNDHGFLSVGFSGPDDAKQVLAMFTTQDGGRSWKLATTVQKDNAAVATTVAASSWITAGIANRKLSLQAITPGGNISSLNPAGHDVGKI
jgi:photosystem II stability/assembly factor-like uncharacterized protein